MIRSFLADPVWLHLWWWLPVCAALLVAYLRWRRRALAALGPGAERLVSGFALSSFWRQAFVWLLAFFLLALAMANPHWGTRQVRQSQQAADVLIAFDISKSMLADDLRPNRLVRARVFAQDLLQQLAGNRIGLVFFAGDAYLSMPPSTDYHTLNSLLAEADPYAYSAQGTAIASVAELARKSFDPASNTGRALVIVTDGEDHEEDPAAAIGELWEEQGIATFMVGAGTPEGALIPLAGGGVQKDANDRPVRSSMDLASLKAIADAGGGAPVYLVSDPDNPAGKLADAIRQLPQKEIAVRQYDEKNSLYQWALLPAILLLFWESRGRKRASHL